MNSSVLIIRADASAGIGVGHVMRCIALGQAWKDHGGLVKFVSAQIPDAISERITSEGFQLTRLTAPAGTSKDSRELLSISERHQAIAIVLDGYHFDEKYHQAVAQYRGVTMVLDDFAHMAHYSTDFILNQNLGASSEQYAGRHEHSELLLGTEFALLRRELLTSPPDRDRIEVIGAIHILVTLGGSDPDNVTSKIIEGLQHVQALQFRARIIVGGLNRHFETIREQLLGDGRFELVRGVEDMASQYTWADVSIAAGGSSNWEMCYFGLPRLVVVIADNQRAIASQLENKGIAINLGEGSGLSPLQVAEAVESLANNSNQMTVARNRALGLVDGLGAARCVRRILGTTKTGGYFAQN